MKKTLAILAAVLSLSVHANEKLLVGATPVPHAEILEFVKPELAREGVDLDIKVFTDFIQPNQQLALKNLDANYYQYRPFLDDFNKTRHTDLVPVVGVPLPLISYGGTAMLTLLFGFGLIMNVYIHRDVGIGRRGGGDD